MADTDLDLGDAFLAALDDFDADAFLDVLDAPEAEAPYDLEEGLKEEAALSAWINRATQRRKAVRRRNLAALVAQERATAGRTYTPRVDGVALGTVTLKGTARAVIVDDPKAFARWVAKNFPTEVTGTVDLGAVDDPGALVDWINAQPDAPVVATLEREVRGSFRNKVVKMLNDAASTTLTWPVDKATGEVRTLDVDGVKLIDVPAEERVHQITFDKKNGGEDAAAAYLEGRGLAALTPGAEDTDA